MLSNSPSSQCSSTILVQSIIKVSSCKHWLCHTWLLSWFAFIATLTMLSSPPPLGNLFLLLLLLLRPLPLSPHEIICSCQLKQLSHSPMVACLFGQLYCLSFNIVRQLNYFLRQQLAHSFSSFLFIYCTCRHYNNNMHAYLGSWTERQINFNSFRDVMTRLPSLIEPTSRATSHVCPSLPSKSSETISAPRSRGEGNHMRPSECSQRSVHLESYHSTIALM